MTAELLREGFVMMVGAEAEHFLVRRREDGSIVPFDPDGVDTLEKPCYDFKSLAGSMGYLRTLVKYLDQLGWEPYASDHEDGTAQFEINWKYSDALTTADRVTFYKMMTSQVAKTFGAIATHMPKPFAHLTGLRHALPHLALGRRPAAEPVPGRARRARPRAVPRWRITSSEASSSTRPPSPPWSPRR